MMTDRIRSFLNERRPDGPCLVVDLDVVRKNYEAFARFMPDSRVFYAVKANPAAEILSLLADLGSSFDTASVAEIEMVLATARLGAIAVPLNARLTAAELGPLLLEGLPQLADVLQCPLAEAIHDLAHDLHVAFSLGPQPADLEIRVPLRAHELLADLEEV